jgi:hypothetical protein
MYPGGNWCGTGGRSLVQDNDIAEIAKSQESDGTRDGAGGARL